MTTPSGTISLSQVNTEIGNPTTTNITLNNTAVRYLAGPPFAPSGSAISMNDLRGRTAQIQATGGNDVITTGTHKIHVFTSPGTLTVNFVYPSANTVEYLVVAGGGGGGTSTSPNFNGAGGGGGGFRTATGFPVSTGGSYPVTVGGGGPGGTPTTRSGGQKEQIRYFQQ